MFELVETKLSVCSIYICIIEECGDWWLSGCSSYIAQWQGQNVYAVNSVRLGLNESHTSSVNRPPHYGGIVLSIIVPAQQVISLEIM